MQNDLGMMSDTVTLDEAESSHINDNEQGETENVVERLEHRVEYLSAH